MSEKIKFVTPTEKGRDESFLYSQAKRLATIAVDNFNETTPDSFYHLGDVMIEHLADVYFNVLMSDTMYKLSKELGIEYKVTE